MYNDMKDSSNDRNNNNNCYKLTKSLQLQREAQLSRVGIEPTTTGFLQMFPLQKVYFTIASLFNNNHNSNTKCTKNSNYTIVDEVRRCTIGIADVTSRGRI